MSHRFKLETSGESYWQLLEDNLFRERLGLPTEPYEPTVTVRELMTPRKGPGEIQEPLRVELEGDGDTDLQLRARGCSDDATTDLLVSPALDAVLSSGQLPAHARLACEGFVFPAGSFGVLPRGRSPKGPHSFVWLWWKEHFASRLDPQRSRFRLRYPDGRSELASYDSLEDLAQVKRRAANTLAFDIAVESVAWADPAIDALDVVPLGEEEVYLSDAMAERLRAAGLSGFVVRPVARTSAAN